MWASRISSTVDRVGRTTRVASYTNLGNVTDQKVWLDYRPHHLWF